MIFDKYPYTNFHEMNDDWIIQTMRLFAEKLEEFVAMNALTYADPIAYDPDTIYPANTVVIYENTAYVSKQAIPAGLLPTTGGEYWLMIFPFGDLIQQGVDVGIAQIDDYLAEADAQITAALNAIPTDVTDWMNQHPEVTTTVQDRSLTYAKLHNSLCDILLANYTAGEVTGFANTEFTQGSIDPITGVKNTSTANSCISSGFLVGHDEIIVLRSAVDFVVSVYDYTDNSTNYQGVTLAAVNANWSAFYAKDGHSYRFAVMAADQSAITPNSLPAVVIYYYQCTSEVAENIDNLYLQARQNYAATIAIEQGFWAVATGLPGDSTTWCRTNKFINNEFIIRTTTSYMWLLAYNKISGDYVGGWNGTQFSTTYNGDLRVREYNIHQFAKEYPDYMFAISFKRANASNITPALIYAEMTVENALWSEIDDLEYTSNIVNDLVDYNNAVSADMAANPSAAANSATRIGVKRDRERIVLTGGLVNVSTYIRVSDTVVRTIVSSEVQAWTGIQLTNGHAYKLMLKHMSGTSSNRISVSVYRAGESSSIGYYRFIDDGSFERFFTAPSGKVNIVVYVPANTQFDTAEYCLLLEDVTDVNAYEQKIVAKNNVNNYPTLWQRGGIGAAGENYDARSTSIRTIHYWDLNNLESLSSGTSSIYIALYDSDKSFVARMQTTGAVRCSDMFNAYPTARYYRIELMNVGGDIGEFEAVVVYADAAPVELDLYNEDKQKAYIIGKHRTSSEDYGTCGLRSLIVADVHAEAGRFGEVIAMLHHWGVDWVDCLMNLGDTVSTVQGDSLAWHNEMLPHIGVPYLNIVGNHDAYGTLGVTGDQVTTYQNIIAPIASQTGVVQPANAATNGLCYYYYDVNNKYRIIALDAIYWNAAEATWLQTVLADAKTNNLAVICMSHYGFTSQYDTAIPSLWREVAGFPADGINIAAAEKVNAFMTGGGTFICWVVGHSHSDNLYKLSSYNNQLVVSLPSLTQRAGNLLKGMQGMYNYIAATYMTVDDYQHTVRFFRIGANIDTWGVQHNGLVLDYVNKSLIAAW